LEHQGCWITPFKDGGSGASAAAFSLRKGFLRKSLSERRQKKRFADFRKEIEQGEIKWTNKKKKLKKYSEHLTKHLRLRQRIVFKIKHSKTISNLGKFPKNQLTPNGLPAHQIKQNTKDKLSQAKAGISPLHAKPQ
jgi:hypothetical protein